MRIPVFITLILCGFVVKAQPKFRITEQMRPLAVQTYYMDSIETSNNYVKYMDPNDIENITVLKNEDHPGGAAYLQLKNHELVLRLLRSNLLSLNEIVKANISDAAKYKQVLYLLDSKLITDTTMLRVPAICVADVTPTKGADTPYFKTLLPDALIVMITTKLVSTKPHPDVKKFKIDGIH